MLVAHEKDDNLLFMHEEYFDLRQLNAFVAVMSEGTITGAAQRLGRSQSVVTRLIQDLETVLGYAILRRNGPRISPTEQGVLFYEEAARLLQSFRHVHDCAFAIGQSAVPPIEISSTPALSVSLVPAALATIDSALFPAKIHVNSVSAERVVQDVVSRTADLGIATLPFDEAGMDVHWIGEAPCVVVLHSGDPLAAQSVVKLRDLGERRIITLASRLRMRIDEALTRARIQPTSLIETNASSTAIAMTRANLGVAVIEPATAFGLPLDGLVIRPLDTLIPFLFGAFSPVGKPVSPTITALSEALYHAASALLPGFRLNVGGPFEPTLERQRKVSQKKVSPEKVRRARG